MGDRRLAVDARHYLEGDLRRRHRRQGLLGVARQRLVLVAHGADGDRLTAVVQGAGQGIARHLEDRVSVFLREAPDLAAGGDRRLVVKIHLRHEAVALALVGHRDDDTAFAVVAEPRGVRHLDPLVGDQVLLGRLERLGHRGAQCVAIRLVEDHEIFAVDEAVGPERVARAGRRDRG